MKKSFVTKAGLVAGLFFLSGGAFATTFGPIPVVDQAENAQYVVHGQIDGPGSAQNAPHIDQPYTYWRLHISSQQLGEALPPEIMVRSPGGEIGEHGYHVAGSAEFNAGENTFIFLRDTDDRPNVKEVVGLASGKYKVDVGPNGRPIVVSGLGLPVTGSNGESLSPDEFSELVRRVARKESTPADRSIFVNRKPMHEHGDESDPNLQAGMKAAAEMLKRRPAEANTETVSSTDAASKVMPAKPPVSQPNPLTETSTNTEETSTGSSNLGWIIAVILGIGLLAGLALFFRR